MENDAFINETYLPFVADDLKKHFAPVNGSDLDADRHLKYYLESAERSRQHASNCTDRRGKPIQELKLPYQIEKDERFWVVACLMTYFYSDDPIKNFSNLLQKCFSEKPPINGLSSWEECLAGKLHLFFEVKLPSPPSYKEWLKENIKDQHMIPYVLDAACKLGSDEIKLGLEGPTHVDAMLICEDKDFAVFIEAKVLSDISCQITFDTTRNQIARNIDVMLDKNPKLPEPLCRRNPDRTLFVLLTPEIFRKQPHTRLYGRLMNEYKTSPEALKRDLPHRKDVNNWQDISNRIGWLTWQDCNTVLPASCPWIK